MIPIILKLKKAKHKEIAKAQDLIIEKLYKVFDKAVLHGGTSIWRCYNGNRFSEDIDVYLQRNIENVNLFFENIKKIGFKIIKKRISEKSIYSELELNRTFVRFEAIFKNIEGILKEYTTVEGNLITIYTLGPEVLVNEKISAYINRLKIRDLYDIYFLLRYVKDRDKIKKDLRLFADKFKQPVDKNELKVLIIEGLVPSVEKMMEYIKEFCD